MTYIWTSKVVLRADVRRDDKRTYLWGDYMQGKGFGGMARELRGEPNAFGIPTKWRPAMDDAAFFSDDDPACRREIEHHISVAEALGKPLVIPLGLGRGLAQMPTRCPKLYEWMCKRLHKDEARHSV